MKNFIARQGIIFLAGILFLVWTAVRVRLGYEKRNIRTFAADCSKQAGQQMLGGAYGDVSARAAAAADDERALNREEVDKDEM